MKYSFLNYQVSVFSSSYTILVPSFELRNLFFLSVDKDAYMLFGDETDLQRLSVVATLSGRMKQTLFFLPIKENLLDSTLKQYNQKAFDVVIMSHQLQFPYKQWKRIRQHLKRGRPVSYEVSETKNLKTHYPLNRDVLHIVSRFDTLFIVGSTPVFNVLSNDCLRVAEKAHFGPHSHNMYHIHADYYTSRNVAFCINHYNRNNI